MRIGIAMCLLNKLLSARGAAFFFLMGIGLAMAGEAPRSFDPIRTALDPVLLRHLQQPEVLAPDGTGERYRMFLLPDLPNFRPEVTTLDVLPDGSGEVHYRIGLCRIEVCDGVASDQRIHVTRIQVGAFRRALADTGFWHQQRIINETVQDGVSIIVDGVRSGQSVQFMRSSICPGRDKPIGTYEQVTHAFGLLRGVSPQPMCVYL